MWQDYNTPNALIENDTGGILINTHSEFRVNSSNKVALVAETGVSLNTQSDLGIQLNALGTGSSEDIGIQGVANGNILLHSHVGNVELESARQTNLTTSDNTNTSSFQINPDNISLTTNDYNISATDEINIDSNQTNINVDEGNVQLGNSANTNVSAYDIKLQQSIGSRTSSGDTLSSYLKNAEFSQDSVQYQGQEICASEGDSGSTFIQLPDKWVETGEHGKALINVNVRLIYRRDDSWVCLVQGNQNTQSTMTILNCAEIPINETWFTVSLAGVYRNSHSNSTAKDWDEKIFIAAVYYPNKGNIWTGSRDIGVILDNKSSNFCATLGYSIPN